MAAPDVYTAGTGSDVRITPQAVVSSAPNGERVTTLYLGSSSPTVRIVDSLSSDQPPGALVVDLNKFDDRLRNVEIALGKIEVRLEEIPTKSALWKGLAVTSIAVIGSLLGGGWWILQQALEPVLAKLAGQ